ncbi:uncharacterized protein PV09_06281 [Verruconis gallopava]|uniref:Uncharacterized protein n=1 Tax=Verruconis gallopava TaxID=253628 RepID=A0A0D1XJK3_9PEZI|nr:uncharacterized protein PV09_06281 [Verruconis gallopava]KIW02476.1 hypothetical protein PV09_06281 [Verruconis gallopava]
MHNENELSMCLSPSTISSRLAELKARREASKKLADNEDTRTICSLAIDEQACILAKKDSPSTELKQRVSKITPPGNGDVTQANLSKAEDDYLVGDNSKVDSLETECPAKQKAEKERQIRAKAEIEIILEEIQKLEVQERNRIEIYYEKLKKAEKQMEEAKLFCSELAVENIEIEKLIVVAEEDVQLAKKRLEDLNKKFSNIKTDLRTAQSLVNETEKTIAELRAADQDAVHKHKKAIDTLIISKTRLEPSLSHPNNPFEDVLGLSASSKLSAKPDCAVASSEDQPKHPSASISTDVSKGHPNLAASLVFSPRCSSETYGVIIEGLPTTKFVLSRLIAILWQGAIHSVRYEEGSTWAHATFLRAEDCEKYLNDTKNGIPWPDDPARIIVTRPRNLESGELEAIKYMANKGMTRCVRALRVSEEWSSVALARLAKKNGRHFERLTNGHIETGERIVDWRFMKISDAVMFMSELSKDDRFQKCDISFARDPCTYANGVHTGWF